ncbi:MAG: hypothetical protein RLZZ584_4019 [Pseudomonadota bacterium]|jgi:hypothetical protein
MSTLSLPSGVYRSSSFTQRLLKVWLPAAQRQVEAAWAAFSTPPQREPGNVAELLAFAQTYESTQPSYAADLRAAALHHESEMLAREAKY